MSRILLGTIVKAFGIHGELKFHPSEDFWEDVLASERLVLSNTGEDGAVETSLRIDRSRPHGKCYVFRLGGVRDRNTAETLVGGDVYIAEDEIDVPVPTELRPFQVVGLAVHDEAGQHLGDVKSVVYSAAHDVYEVAGPGGDFLVPAVPEFIVDVDLEKRRLVVRPIPGLIGD